MAGRGGNKQPPILLGGASVPVPAGDGDLDGGDDLMSPARKRQGGGGLDQVLPSKKEKVEVETVTLDVAKIRGLLGEQSRELLAAQQGQLEKAMKEMEARVDCRVTQVEGQVAALAGQNGALESKVAGLEAALQELAGAVKEGRAHGSRASEDEVGAERRRSTLVIGGWPRDSRRQDILRELNEAIQKLGLKDSVDQEPFCTGRGAPWLCCLSQPGQGNQKLTSEPACSSSCRTLPRMTSTVGLGPSFGAASRRHQRSGQWRGTLRLSSESLPRLTRTLLLTTWTLNTKLAQHGGRTACCARLASRFHPSMTTRVSITSARRPTGTGLMSASCPSWWARVSSK